MVTLSGPDALRALDEALRDIRREEDEVAKRASRNAELLIKLRAQEAELYRQLGANRLEPEMRARQAGLIAGINNAVEAAISRYDAAFADAEAVLQHIEASIAATHCMASDASATDWPRILHLYDQLLALTGSPVTAMNRAVAVAPVHVAQAGLDAVGGELQIGRQ